MGTTIFYLIQLGLRKFRFNSTHDSPWLYENWFKSAHDSEEFLKFDSNRVMTQKLSVILIRIKSWLNDPKQLSISLTFLCFHSIPLPFFGLSLYIIGLFWAFDSSALIRNSSWLKQHLEELNRFNSLLKRLSRNWHRINSWLSQWVPRVLMQITRRKMTCAVDAP